MLGRVTKGLSQIPKDLEKYSRMAGIKHFTGQMPCLVPNHQCQSTKVVINSNGQTLKYETNSRPSC